MFVLFASGGQFPIKREGFFFSVFSEKSIYSEQRKIDVLCTSLIIGSRRNEHCMHHNQQSMVPILRVQNF